MQQARFDGSFAGWRAVARQLLQQGIAPHDITWLGEQDVSSLFDQAGLPDNFAASAEPIRIPRQLLEQLEAAAAFRTRDRWSLLYRVLWRVTQGDNAAMLAGDRDGSELHKRIKAVRREAHHLHAFLRFHPKSLPGGPQFVAWFEPAHDILPSAAEHFTERMGLHSWLIATPDDGVFWDGHNLQHSRPCPAQWRELAQRPEDKGEALWLAYYGSTFNPARLNRDVLENNLPVRFWRNLPEGMLIPQLMSRARAGAQRDGQAEDVARRIGKRILQRQKRVD